MSDAKDLLEGYLFSKLHAIGSKSEGPSYFLQLTRPETAGKELPIHKKTEMWMNDTVLQGCIGRKVTLRSRPAAPGAAPEAGTEAGTEAAAAPTGIDYVEVLSSAEPLVLGLKMDLKDDTLWIDREPGPAPAFPPRPKRLDLTFEVLWPYRSEWKGSCPTSQFMELTIEDPQGRTIWRWSSEMLFSAEPTEIKFLGGSPKGMTVHWHYFDSAIAMAGLYVATATFIASGQTIRRPFWIKFAY